MHIKKIVVTKKNWVYEVPDPNISLHIDEGAIDRTELSKDTDKVKLSTGDEALLLSATFYDNLRRMKRNAATVNPKDAGYIIAYLGINKNSTVLDAGAGSGSLACRLAGIAKKVYTVDNDERAIKIVKKNAERLDLDNLEVIQGDITKINIPEQVDVFTLDVPDPEKAIPKAKQILKNGGFLVCYTPQITQVKNIIDSLDENWRHEKTIELLERYWEVGEKKLRPKHNMLGHTAFLTFIRLFRR